MQSEPIHRIQILTTEVNNQMNDSYLMHYGISGQKWGIRRFQNLDRTWTEEGKDRYYTPKNTKFLKNYDGPAYFVSSESNLKRLKPRVPVNYFTKNGYEDSKTRRVCFSSSMRGCLAALSQNLKGKHFTVYSPEDIKSHRVYKPNNKAVPDSDITDEMWICSPVKLKKIGELKVTGDRGESGKKFSYGNRTATLYDDWDYKFTKIPEKKQPNYLMHYGIKSQEWGVRRFQEKGSSKRTPEGKIRYAHSDKTTSEKKKVVGKVPERSMKRLISLKQRRVSLYRSLKQRSKIPEEERNDLIRQYKETKSAYETLLMNQCTSMYKDSDSINFAYDAISEAIDRQI